MENKEIDVQLNPAIHNHYLNIIKRLLQASFVGWVKEKDKKYLKVVTKQGTASINFEGEFIGEASYEKLIKDIIQTLRDGRQEIQEPVQLPIEEQGVETDNAE